jgi:hypothetical protein
MKKISVEEIDNGIGYFICGFIGKFGGLGWEGIFV